MGVDEPRDSILKSAVKAPKAAIYSFAQGHQSSLAVRSGNQVAP